jgi:O-antigen ligase
MLMKNSFNSGFLALGIVVSTATQLRFSSGFPIGPGEIVLSIWILGNFLRFFHNLNTKVDRIIVGIMVFLTLVVLNLIIGTFFGFYTGRISVDETLRYSIALTLNVSVFLILLLRYSREKVFIYELIKSYIKVMIFFHTPILILSYFSPNFLGFNLYDGRFNSLALNPNTIATACLPIPYLVIYLHQEIKNLNFRFYYACGFCALCIGFACYSDALVISWVTSVFVFFLFLWISQFNSSSKYKIRSPSKLFVVVFIIPVLTAGISIFTLNFINDRIFESGDDQSGVRSILWQNGIKAGLESPIFGLGLGAYSGFAGPFENTEAHNVYIDWFSNTGIFGLFVLIFGCVYLFSITLKSRSIPIVCLLLSLYLLAFSHLITRQPTTWLIISILFMNFFKANPVKKH